MRWSKAVKRPPNLYIEGAKLSDQTIEVLLDELPNCRIEVK
jgi:hypothetical protein